MPNENKQLNFTLKVWDSTTNSYKPCYIAPDATNAVQGDVLLSDAVDSTLNAASGMTAATPAAVRTVQTNANNKLDKTTSSNQTVASAVTFNNAITVNRGVTVPSDFFFTGNLQGNATTASTLQTARQISVRVGTGTAGTANFNGGANASITIPQVDASVVTKGTLPLSVLPQGALERLVRVENQTARFKLTTSDVQLGDSVLQLDTNIMYVVINTAELDNAAGYQEYAAGTAVSADTADRVAHSLTVKKNGVQQFIFDGSTAQTLNIATSFADLEGQIALNQIPDSLITSAKVNFNYAGSSSKGGAATSAVKLQTAREIAFTGVVTGSSMFDGSDDISFATTLTNSSVTEPKLADNAVTTAKLSDNSVTSAKIVNGTITGSDIAATTITASNIVNSTITGSKIAANTITGTNLADDAVTAAKIATNAVTADAIAAGAVGSSEIADGGVGTAELAENSVNLTKLASDVGTIAIQSAQPTDSNVLLWVQI